MRVAQKTLADIDVSSKISKAMRQYGSDIVIVIVLALIAGIAAYQGARHIDPLAFYIENVWFESDIPRVVENMVFQGSDHYRTKVHPLFSAIAFPPVFLLKTALGIDPFTSVRLVTSTVASLWVGTLFGLLRLIGCQRLDAALFSVVGATSAAAMFWFTVPETYSFGSLSLLLALCFVTVAQYRQFSALWYVAVSALTLSFTLTNWTTGLLATFVNHSRKRALQITIHALCLVVLLWSVQKLAFPSAEFFLGDREEKQYVFTNGSGGFLQVLKGFVANSIVMPAVQVVDHLNSNENLIEKHLSIQFAIPGSGSPWGVIAVGLWTALLGLGLWALFSVRKHPKLRLVLGLTLLGQLVLHLLYGDETFLYTLHFAPLLVVVAALSTLTRVRLLALVLAGMLALTAGMNNMVQLGKARALFNSYLPLHHLVQTQMQRRPSDPWPRGTGQVVLAAPNSPESERAFHEPGGGFSPIRGSFGVSLWFVDRSGNLKMTSDRIPLSEIHQELIPPKAEKPTGILTKTNAYEALWSSQGRGRWLLNLNIGPNPDTKPLLVIRSVGPAGGQVRSLVWKDKNKKDKHKQLVINHRWIVTFDSLPTAVHLGNEGDENWTIERSKLTEWKKGKGHNGWGYARIELTNANEWKIAIQDAFTGTSK